MLITAKGLGVLAMVGLAAVASPTTAQDLVQAGVSAAVRGDVQLARADIVGRQINSGEEIFLQDSIQSGSEAGMQILLLDETVFTIGPESEISIDEFVYDPATGQGSLAASVGKGLMRFATGKISDGTPENMTIKLPVGTIGIRGTRGMVVVLTEAQAAQQFPEQAPQSSGDPNQPVIFAALTGPGPLSQTGGGVGSFNFSSPNGSIDLNRPGGAVLATSGQPPVFFIAPPGTLQQVSQGFSGTRGTQSTGGTDEQSGPAQSDGGGSQIASANNQSNAGNDTSFTQVNQIVSGTESSSSSRDSASDVATASAGSLSFSDLAGFSGSITFPTVTSQGAANLSISSFSIGFSDRDIIFDGSVDGGNVHTGVGGVSSVSWSNLANSNGSAQFRLGQNGGSFQNISSNAGCASCTVAITFTSQNNVNISATDNANETTNVSLTAGGGNS